jgi:hypothetical protein
LCGGCNWRGMVCSGAFRHTVHLYRTVTGTALVGPDKRRVVPCFGRHVRDQSPRATWRAGVITAEFVLRYEKHLRHSVAFRRICFRRPVLARGMPHNTCNILASVRPLSAVINGSCAVVPSAGLYIAASYGSVLTRPGPGAGLSPRAVSLPSLFPCLLDFLHLKFVLVFTCTYPMHATCLSIPLWGQNVFCMIPAFTTISIYIVMILTVT